MMDAAFHRFSELFAQLGLPDDIESIKAFIAAHAPLAGHVRLHEAGFWTPQQAAFLRASLAEDADWAPVVDQLSLALREP